MKKSIASILLSVIAASCFVLGAAANAPGDVTGDGNVTAADVTAVYNFLLSGDTTFESTSDVNGDNNITSADITLIYNILLGNN